MRARLSTSLVALAALLSTPFAPASAQDDAQTEQEREMKHLKDELDLVKARNDLAAARDEGLQKQIDALGLPKTEGKTTLEGEGGKLEGWMLASSTLTTAAKAINESATAKAGVGPIVLLDGDDVLDLRVSQLLKSDVDVLSQAHRRASVAVKCPALSGDSAGAALELPIAPLVGAVLSLLKTDTTISGFALETPDGALLNAIAGSKENTYILPADLVATGTAGPSLTLVKELAGLSEAARACRADIASAAISEADKKAVAPSLAALDALATRTQDFLDDVSERKDGKPSRLENAMVADVLIPNIITTRILRVHVEKAGGSILKRSNLFTMLGASAIGLTGGTVISWRLSSPVTGRSLAGGILVCRTKLTNMNAIHAGRVKVGDSSCNSNLSTTSQGSARP
jgi:hypothetical protein